MRIAKVYLSGTVLGTIFGSGVFITCVLLPYLVAGYFLKLNVNHSQVVLITIFFSFFGAVGFAAFCLPTLANCSAFVKNKLNVIGKWGSLNEALSELCGLLTGFLIVLKSANLLLLVA